MSIGVKKELCWAVGLDEERILALQDCLDQESVLKSYTEAPVFEEVKTQDPVAIFIAVSSWAGMSGLQRNALDSCAKVFMLSANDSIDSLESMFNASNMGVLKPEFDPEAIEPAMRRCREYHRARGDHRRMSHEIDLQREIFMRKCDYLDFVFHFFPYAGEHLDPVEIIRRTAEGLREIMPLENIHGVFWSPDKDGRLNLDLYIDADSVELEKEIKELLVSAAENMTGVKRFACRVNSLSGGVDAQVCPRPGNRKIMLAPLRIEDQPFGCMVLLSREEINVGRDQMGLIHAVMAHLQLAIYSSLQKKWRSGSAEEGEIMLGPSDSRALKPAVGNIYS